MTRRPHLLLTAWAFPPARTSGVHRAVGIANAFVASGWDVTALCAPAAVFEANAMTDPSLADALDGRVEIRPVPFSSPAYDTEIGTWSRLRARQPELWNAIGLRREARTFPEPGFGSWRPALEGAAEAVHREHPVDVALGTANPHVDFIPGWHLKRTAGVAAIMDYRDAWTIDVFTGNDRAAASARERAWEDDLMEHADRVWFVNETIRGWHAARHPGVADRMRVVPNGFDITDGRSPAVPFRAPSADDGLTFGYVGTINFGQFPARPLFEGWQLARERDALVARSRLVLRGHLGRTGVAGEELQRLLDAATTHGVSYGGPVPKAELADAYAGFDGLVLALASGPGVTSGKVFEFAATGLPVLSVHDPESAASSVMRGSPAWQAVASLSPEDVADGIIRLARATLAQTDRSRATAIEWGAQWERSRQLQRAVDETTRLADERMG